MSMPTLYSKLRVPRCWKRLVTTVFPEDLHGVLGERTNHTGVVDPKPHYDDSRVVSCKFADGYTMTLFLGSGQGNYWAALELADAQGIPVSISDPFFNLADDDEVVVTKNLRYVANLEYYGRL